MKERLRVSFGSCHINDGIPTEIKEEKCSLDYSRRFYLFDVIPMGAVRMTKSDTWKLDPNHPDPKKRQRKAVTQYFKFKNILTEQAEKMQFKLQKTLDAIYVIPMPQSWSEKKKKQMNGMPCMSKPDCDNITKAIKDTLKKEDSDVWYEFARKYWGYKGSIIIYA